MTWTVFCFAYFLKNFNIVHNSYWKFIDRIFVASVIEWLEKDCYIPVYMSEFLQHLVNERMQNFCFIQLYKLATLFLWRLMYECSQNFCDTLWMSACRISATPSESVVAEFLQHPVYGWLRNFCIEFFKELNKRKHQKLLSTPHP